MLCAPSQYHLLSQYTIILCTAMTFNPDILSCHPTLVQSYSLAILFLQWRSDVDRNIKLPNGQPLPVILMVNKVDSVKDAAAINKAEFDK
jgi:hypothetical protein